MTTGEASEVLTILAAAFPQRWRNATPEETQLWIEFLQTLDYDGAMDTSMKIINSASHMPSVAEFRMTYRSTVVHEALPEQGYEHDPTTPHEWEEAAKRARLWRKDNYPQTKDPAEGKPLPRTRETFGQEWTAWFYEHFGWSPIAADKITKKMA